MGEEERERPRERKETQQEYRRREKRRGPEIGGDPDLCSLLPAGCSSAAIITTSETCCSHGASLCGCKGTGWRVEGGKGPPIAPQTPPSDPTLLFGKTTHRPCCPGRQFRRMSLNNLLTVY